MRPLLALIRKDALLFAADRQAVVMSFVIPILIASILGWLDLSSTIEDSNKKTPVLVADDDQSPQSKAIVANLQHNKNLTISIVPESEAAQDLKQGKQDVAIVFRKGFGAEAANAMSGGAPAGLTILQDPSKPIASQIAEQVVYQEASKVVASQTFGSLVPDQSPVSVHVQSVTAKDVDWAKSAHDYSGFGLMGVLFFAVESGVMLARERRSGVWKRLRSSPVSRALILLSKACSSTVLALAIILSMFLVGALLFGIRVLGSFAGFLLMAGCTALMSATFGLLLSTLGRTETQSRGLSILVIFVMLATGGAWFPLSRMPDIVQTLALGFPVRWAVEGFDLTTWRGLPFDYAMRNAAILLGFSALFVAASLLRFARLRDD